MDFEVEYLKKQGLDKNGIVSLEAIHAMKQLREIMFQQVDAPEPFKSVLEGWNQLRFMGMATVANDTYPALTKCWHDLNEVFGPSFEDEDFVNGYCLLDFPCHEGLSFADIFYDDCSNDEGMEHLKGFANKMRHTRLGLYQVVASNPKFVKLEELITNKTVDVHNTFEFGRGEILLARLVPVGKHFMVFASPKGFPAERKSVLEDMVRTKAQMYYGQSASQGSDDHLYELHMKQSGPYWMSVVTPDESIDILNPDYQHRYSVGSMS